MQIYKNSVIVTTLISIVSFMASFVLKFYLTGKEVGFWYDISIGVFGGAILTLITSVIGYRVERRKALEGFWLYIQKILKYFSNYESSMTVEQKIGFFIDLYNLDRVEMNTYLGDIHFLFDWKEKTFRYIYNSIYCPIERIYNLVTLYYGDLKAYKNGFNRNDGDIQSYISKIESLIIEKTIYKVPSAIDEKGRVISESVLPKERNKIVDSIADELNNRYYIIMYGKRTYKKENAKQNK